MIEDAQVQNRVSRAQAQRSRAECVRQGRYPRQRPNERDAVFITSYVTHATRFAMSLNTVRGYVMPPTSLCRSTGSMLGASMLRVGGRMRWEWRLAAGSLTRKRMAWAAVLVSLGRTGLVLDQRQGANDP